MATLKQIEQALTLVELCEAANEWLDENDWDDAPQNFWCELPEYTTQDDRRSLDTYAVWSYDDDNVLVFDANHERLTIEARCVRCHEASFNCSCE